MRRKRNSTSLVSALMNCTHGDQPILKVENATHIAGDKEGNLRTIHPDEIIVLESGHVVHLENPKDFAQILADKLPF